MVRILIFLCVVLVVGLLPAQDTDFTLSVGDGAGAVGDEVTVVVRLDHEASDIRGFHFGVCHDPDLMSLSEGDVENGDGLMSASIETQFIEIFDDGWIVDSLWCVPCDSVMMPAGEHDLFEVTYDLLDVGVAELELCESLGDPEVTVRIVDFDGEDGIEPVTESGMLTISGEFLRGDFDGNGSVNALVDVLGLLEWVFLGGAAPQCEDAADFDDSGELNGLLDGLFLLEWSFQSGDVPPAPGPDECGGDPTEDELGCEVASEGC